MKTYQDLLNVGDDAQKRLEFVFSVIADHKASPDFKTAETAVLYDKQQNKTIMDYQKLLYTVTGQTVPDNYSANHKLCSNFFDYFVTQENQYLLGNGINWQDEKTADALGKDFDTKLQQAGHDALVQKCAFGFWNYDHLEVFGYTEFAPIFDEEDGSLKAGVRFWQIDAYKPLRAIFFELDGYTDYIWSRRDEDGTLQREYEGAILHPKRTYKQIVETSTADGEQISDFENYPGFPIIPLYANPNKQSELVGRREQIDCYDLIKSGFANDVDDASLIYWTLQNAGGMDDIDLAKFVQRMRTLKAAAVDSPGAVAESHTVDVPYASREAILNRLRVDLYESFMALDTKIIAGGAVTATQIRAAYEPLNSKTDKFEYEVRTFLSALLKLIGIEDSPSFSRSTIVNSSEEVTMLLQAAQFLPQDYILKKLLTIFGDVDQIDDVKAQMDEENMAKMQMLLAQQAAENGGVDVE